MLTTSCFFLSFLIGEQLLYSLVLVSAVPQHDSATGIYMSPSCWNSLPSPCPSYPSRLSQSTRLSSLCHRANSHLLWFYIRSYMSPCYSLSWSHPLFPHCVHKSVVCSLCLRLHLCLTNRFISNIFLDALIYICLSLTYIPFFLVVLFLILDLICNETVKGFHGMKMATTECYILA